MSTRVVPVDIQLVSNAHLIQQAEIQDIDTDTGNIVIENIPVYSQGDEEEVINVNKPHYKHISRTHLDREGSSNSVSYARDTMEDAVEYSNKTDSKEKHTKKENELIEMKPLIDTDGSLKEQSLKVEEVSQEKEKVKLTEDDKGKTVAMSISDINLKEPYLHYVYTDKGYVPPADYYILGSNYDYNIKVLLFPCLTKIILYNGNDKTKTSFKILKFNDNIREFVEETILVHDDEESECKCVKMEVNHDGTLLAIQLRHT